MANEKKIVAGITLLTQQPKQAMEDLLAAEKHLSDGGEHMATSFSKGFETIENRAERMAQRLRESGAVSNTEFAKAANELSRMHDAAEASFGSIEKAPAEIQKALEVAEKQLVNVSAAMQVSTTRGADFTAKLREAGASAAGLNDLPATVDRSATSIKALNELLGEVPSKLAAIAKSDTVYKDQISEQEKVLASLREEEKSLEKLGDSGQKDLVRVKDAIAQVETAMKRAATESTSASGKMHDAAVRVKQAEDALTEAIASGSPKAGNAIVKLNNANILLRESIDQVRKETGVTSAEMVAEFARVEKAIAAATVTVRKLRDDGKDLRAEFEEGGETWSGLGAAINKALGPLGGVQAKLALVGAALTEGIQIGHSFAQSIGTDFHEMDTIVDDLKGRLRNWFSTMADGVFDSTVSLSRMDAALNLTADAFKGLKIVEDLSGKSLEDYSTKAKQLAVIGKTDNDILTAGTRLQTLWRQEKLASAGNIDVLSAATVKYNHLIEVHNGLMAGGLAGERLWNELQITHATTIAELDAKLKALGVDTKSFAASQSDAAVKTAAFVKELGSETAAFIHLAESVKEQLDNAQKYEDAQDGTTKSIQDAAKHVAELSQQYDDNGKFMGDEIRHLQQLGDTTIGASAEVKKHIQVIVAAQTSIETLTDANAGLRNEVFSTTKAFDQLTREEIADREEKQRQIVANDFLIAQAKGRIEVEAKAAAGIKDGTDATAKASQATVNLTGDLKSHTGAISNVEAAVEGAATKTGDLAGSMEKAGSSTIKVSGNLKDGTAAISQVGNASKIAADQMIGFNGQIGHFSEGTKKIKDPADSFKKVVHELADEAGALATKINSLSREVSSFGIACSTAAGQANKLADAKKKLLDEPSSTTPGTPQSGGYRPPAPGKLQ